MNATDLIGNETDSSDGLVPTLPRPTSIRMSPFGVTQNSFINFKKRFWVLLTNWTGQPTEYKSQTTVLI